MYILPSENVPSPFLPLNYFFIKSKIDEIFCYFIIPNNRYSEIQKNKSQLQSKIFVLE